MTTKILNIPSIKWVENRKLHGYGDSSYYTYSYDLAWEDKQLNICDIDSQDSIDIIVMDHLKGTHLSSGPSTRYGTTVTSTADYDSFIEKNKNVDVLEKLKQQYETSRLKWKLIIKNCVPIVLKWYNGDPTEIFINITDKDLLLFISDILEPDDWGNSGPELGMIEDDELLNHIATKIDWDTFSRLKSEIWRKMSKSMYPENLKNRYDYAAFFVWYNSKSLKNPHDGLKALKKLDHTSNFFAGMKQLFDGIINCDSRLVLEGYRNVRRDENIPAYIVNHMKDDIEKTVKHVSELEGKEKIRVDQIIDQKDIKIGAYVEKGYASGSVHQDNSQEITVKDSVLQRSSIGGSSQRRIKICPYCGEKLDFPEVPKFCPYCEKQILH